MTCQPPAVPLIQGAPFAQTALLAYTLFVDPLPIWSPPGLWATLLVPLCLAVAVVYKSIKCRSVRSIPREAAVLFVFILGGMIAAAAVLAGVVRLMD